MIFTKEHAEALGLGQREIQLSKQLGIDYLTLIKLLIQLGTLLLPFLMSVKKRRKIDPTSCQDLFAAADDFKRGS